MTRGLRQYSVHVPGTSELPYLVEQLQDYLASKINDAVLCVILHGSVGTNEIIAYSDLDVLAIIKDNHLTEKEYLRVIKELTKSLGFFYKFDPLQHHGWFIIKESQLCNYPQTYFPYEIFQYSKCVLPRSGIDLTLSFNELLIDFVGPLRHLCTSLLYKIEVFWQPKNIYQLKSFLSEFMLLPTFYLQAKGKRGIFKKFSFNIARQDFSDDEWRIMDTISEIRDNWHYELTGWQQFLLTRFNPKLRKIIVRLVPPAIPQHLIELMDDIFYSDMKRFVNSALDKSNAF